MPETAIQNQRNSFSRGFPLPFNVETLQAFGALFQIPQYYRKFLYYKTKMLCNYVINIKFLLSLLIIEIIAKYIVQNWWRRRDIYKFKLQLIISHV
jgi:hypothetical protein